MVEAKYIGASDATKEAIWIHFLYARILYVRGSKKHVHSREASAGHYIRVSVRRL